MVLLKEIGRATFSNRGVRSMVDFIHGVISPFSTNEYFWYNFIQKRLFFNSIGGYDPEVLPALFQSQMVLDLSEKTHLLWTTISVFRFPKYPISMMADILDNSLDSTESLLEIKDSTEGSSKGSLSSEDSILPLSPFRRLQTKAMNTSCMSVLNETTISNDSSNIELTATLNHTSELSDLEEDSHTILGDETVEKNVQKKEEYNNSKADDKNRTDEVTFTTEAPKNKSSKSSEKRKHVELTHFISIPLTHECFQKNFLAFKESVLKNCNNDRGVCERLFTKKEKLHLTVSVLTLSDEEVEMAVQFLETCKETVLKPLLKENQMHLHMKGLGFFNGKNPKAANVLFANVMHPDDPTVLQTILNDIRYRLIKEGLLSKKEDVKLNIHATLMKTTKATRFKKFDVENIIKLYGNYSFGEGIATQIDLSLFKSYQKNGYYKSAATVNF